MFHTTHACTDRPELKAKRWTNTKKNQTEDPPIKDKGKYNRASSEPTLNLQTFEVEHVSSATAGANEYTQSMTREKKYEAIDVTKTDYVQMYTSRS